MRAPTRPVRSTGFPRSLPLPETLQLARATPVPTPQYQYQGQGSRSFMERRGVGAVMACCRGESVGGPRCVVAWLARDAQRADAGASLQDHPRCRNCDMSWRWRRWTRIAIFGMCSWPSSRARLSRCVGRSTLGLHPLADLCCNSSLAPTALSKLWPFCCERSIRARSGGRSACSS